MGLTAYAQEEKAKREAWREMSELRKRIAELEAQVERLRMRVVNALRVGDLTNSVPKMIKTLEGGLDK